jgi:hypothetical protein
MPQSRHDRLKENQTVLRFPLGELGVLFAIAGSVIAFLREDLTLIVASTVLGVGAGRHIARSLAQASHRRYLPRNRNRGSSGPNQRSAEG